jgi:hypothetical protein
MNQSSTSVPTWFKVVMVILILWNIMGIMSFFGQVFISEDTLALLSENERALYAQYPLWAQTVYAIAVFAGLAGSIGLLMRKKWAIPQLILSLIAIIIQMGHSVFMTDAVAVYGNVTYVMPTLVVLVASFEVYLAMKVDKKGWLK